MKYILNSAVIATQGRYSYELIEIDKAKEFLKEERIISALGYIETAQALSTITGIKVAVNRQQIKMKENDEALVFRLTCRLDDPMLKGCLDSDFILQNSEIGILKKEKDF